MGFLIEDSSSDLIFMAKLSFEDVNNVRQQLFEHQEENTKETNFALYDFPFTTPSSKTSDYRKMLTKSKELR